MSTLGAVRTPFRIKGWHVLAGFILFFGTIIALDSVFMVLAYRSFPGQSADNPYETGLRFNRELDLKAREAALGWQVQARLGASGEMVLDIRDKTGAPLEGLNVAGSLVRPATEAGRLAAVFRQIAPGRYVAAAPAQKGAWDVTLRIADQRGRFIETERRLIWH